jgi:anti-anti-sigma factor
MSNLNHATSSSWSFPVALHAELFDRLPMPISNWQMPDLDNPSSLVFISANAAAQNQIQRTNILPGRRLVDVYPDMQAELLNAYAQVLRSGQPASLGEIRFPVKEGGFQVHDVQAYPFEGNYLSIVHVDVTDRLRAEEAVRQAVAQEEALRAQNAVLAELSTPLIPISDDVMVMPLIGAVDSRRAQQVLQALLEGTASRNARTVILDITGVPVVDTQVANALIGAARALRLLGAQVVLTGIRPEVAQTMVGLGVDLGSVTTRSSLQSGIAFAINQS